VIPDTISKIDTLVLHLVIMEENPQAYKITITSCPLFPELEGNVYGLE